MAMVIKRFDVYLVSLAPSVGHEIKKTRPCVVISPDEMNRHISTAIIAPMTSRRHRYPSRIPCQFKGKEGEIVLDQIRTVDKKRLVKRLGKISSGTQDEILSLLSEIFAP